MSTILPSLIAAFADHGLTIRAEAGEARTNDPDAQFAKAFRPDGTRLRAGAGLAFSEVLFLEHLVSHLRGECLVIGNGFGWSAIALGMMLRGRGRVLAMDACLDGDVADEGLRLANAIAAEQVLPVRAIRGTSPEDVDALVREHCGGQLDLVLIDGLHSEEQQALDYAAVKPWLTPDAVVLFHDVVNWRLDAGFRALAATEDRAASLLHRTASGMAILYPRDASYRPLVEAFVGDPPRSVEGASSWATRYEGLWRSYLWRGEVATSEKYFALALREVEDPAALWLSRAGLHADQGAWEDCLRAVEACEGLDDTRAASRYWRAMALRARGAAPAEVHAAFAHALGGIGVTPEFRLDAGLAAFDAGHIGEALALAEVVIEERPDWSLPRHLRALCARARGAAAGEMAVLLEEAMACAPMTAPLAFDAACVAFDSGQVETARRLAGTAVSLRPDWGDARALHEALMALAGAPS